MGLDKLYNVGSRVEVCALSNVSFEIPATRFVVFYGPSGSGKTTLLSIIGTLERQTRGQLLFRGKDVGAFSDLALSRIRRRYFGFVFQNFNLIFGVSAWRNVAYPLIPTGISDEMLFKRASQVLEKLGLKERLSHRPEQMSGGEQQRVALARALINDPEIIIADEPTSNIDDQLVRGVLDLFHALKDEGRTIVVTSHNPVFLEQADTVFYLKEGRILRVGGSTQNDDTQRL